RPVFLSNIGDQAKAVRLRRGAAASRMGCGGTEEYPVWDPTGQSEGARMILKRCACHRLHRLAFMGVSARWPLRRLGGSGGMCPRGARRLLRLIELQGR